MDVGTRRWAEGQLEERVEAALAPAADAGAVHASLHSFPFLGRLLVLGDVSRLRVAVAPLAAAGIRFGSVEVVLRGVKIDRDSLLSDRQVRLTAIDEGEVTAVLSQDEVSRLLGVPVTFVPGRVAATVAGTPLEAEVRVREGRLEIVPVRGAALGVRVPAVPLVPCVTSAEVRLREVALRCTIEDVPPELVRAASRAAT